MKVLLDRWQFGVTITYHFLLVPLTIGLAFLVAIMQVLAYRRRDEVWERFTRFFGTLFLINFAMGVVTGIVQEFQFGMNWSNYSVFVGNIFGAPLAMEGLLAFFAESTFIALWMFGRNRLPPLAHTLSICILIIKTQQRRADSANRDLAEPPGSARQESRFTRRDHVHHGPFAMMEIPGSSMRTGTAVRCRRRGER